MEIQSLLDIIHNLGSAADGAGTGSLPVFFGGILGSWGSVMDQGVRGKIIERAQNQAEEAQQQKELRDLFDEMR